MLSVVVVAMLVLSSQSLYAAPPSNADATVAKAEEIRCPPEDYVVDVELTDVKSEGGKTDTRAYESFLKGKDKALVKFVLPADENRTRVLMVDTDMWVQMPTTAKPVRVSARQKLMGNAAYGDVARLTFVGNYTAKFVREDKFGQEDAWVFDLTAIAGRPVTYDRVEYWVSRATNRPLRAYYQTAAGKIIREGLFEGYAEVFGKSRPQRFVLVDHLRKDHVTTLLFKNPRKKNLPDLLFEKQNLGRE
jgi:hypothetical protein